MPEWLINLCINAFGSLSAAAVGCLLAHRYLRRKDEDAVRESRAVRESNELRHTLVSFQGKRLFDDISPGVSIVMQSGSRFYIKKVEHVGADTVRLQCTTPEAETVAVHIAKPANGRLFLFRLDAIAEMALPDRLLFDVVEIAE